MQNIENIVRLIIEKEDKILLCKSKEQGHYFLPGGHVEFGDTLEKTIYKEMEEELGLSENDLFDISFRNYLENTYGEDEKMHHEINFIFEAKLPVGIEIKSQEDHIDFEWFDMENIGSINLLPKNILTI
jgi:ADP-ribose pyrophosphatase YjhB (NUDIX family)